MHKLLLNLIVIATVISIGILSSPNLHAHEGDHGELADEQVMLTAALRYDNEIEIQKTDQHLIIQSNGIPQHTVGKFPNRSNPNTISAQQHRFQIPLVPAATGKFERKEGKMGVAVNGVPFEPGTAETWQGNRAWRMEAIVAGVGKLGLDHNNAHVQPTGAYHYHGVPHGLIKDLRQKSGTSASEALLVGWAADGYPIYYKEGVQPSYQLKPGSRPDGPGGHHDGTYTADFEFQPRSGDLDEANGLFGPTPENPDGEYHYYVTEGFLFLPRVLKGQADNSFSHPRGGRGQGRPGQRPPHEPPPGKGRPPHPNGPPPHHMQST